MKPYILLIGIILLVSLASASDQGIDLTVSFTGNTTWQNFTIYDIDATSWCPASTSVIIGPDGTVAGCYNQTNIEDMSYAIAAEGYTSSGTVYESGTTWFKRTTNPIAGLSPEFALFIALFIMMFTALMAGTSTAPAMSLVVTFEGWVFYGLNMFAIIDPVPLYVDPASGSTTVPLVLTIMTFICIVWLFLEYRRKNK